jgi:hypothetical protein
MVNKQYEEIYKKTKNRMAYLEACKKAGLKYNSSLRRYYDLFEMNTGGSVKDFKPDNIVKKENTIIEKKKELRQFHDGLRTSVNEIKLAKVKDMRRLGFETTRVYLKKHGYSDSEINWLDDAGLVDEGINKEM